MQQSSMFSVNQKAYVEVLQRQIHYIDFVFIKTALFHL